MTGQRTAWAIPTFPPHFARTARLLDSVATHSLDLDPVVVFTHEDDYRRFSGEHPGGFAFLVASDYLPLPDLREAEERRSIINVKKLIAVWELRRDYEWVFTPDSECTVIGPGDPTRTFEIRRAHRTWPAQRVEDSFLRDIIAGCIDVFDVRDRATLRQKTEFCSLYGWFEDVPGYHRDDARAFFEYFGSSEDPTSLFAALTWQTFDHLVYQLFCCLDRGWSFLDSGLPASTRRCAAWEDPWPDPETRDAFDRLRRGWPASWTLAGTTAAETAAGAFITFHDDRSGG